MAKGPIVNHMVKQSPALDALFGALSDPTRRGMLARLARGPATVGELGAPWDISAPAVSRHVKVLERAGLLRRRREGREHICQLEADNLARAERWLAEQRAFWEASLDRLELHLRDNP